MDIGKWINFDEFMTPKLITIVYVLGVIGITLFSLALLVLGGSLIGMGGNAGGLGFLLGIILAIIVFIVGNIVLRVYCEIFIILFKIHDHLESIDEYFIAMKRTS